MNRAAGPVLGVAFLAGSLALLSGTLVAQERSGPQRLEAAPEELRNIQRHGPWPQPVPRDPSNRASGKAEAIALGRALFFEARQSPRGDLSCAVCHQPGRALTDGRARAQGGAARPRLDRNVPGLWNTGHARWYGWDGGSDSLWSFALRPLLHPDEMGATPAHVAQILRSDATLACRYRNAFGRNVPPAAAAESVPVTMTALYSACVTATSPIQKPRVRCTSCTGRSSVSPSFEPIWKLPGAT